MKDAKPLGDILAEYMKASGLSRRSKVSSASAAWLEAVGEKYGAHSRVAGLKRGVLHVLVDSAACLHEMATFRKAEILAELQKQSGCEHVHDIKFRLGNLE